MATGSSGRSQRRINRPTAPPVGSSLKRSVGSPDRGLSARRGLRVSFFRCRQAVALFLVGAVCALALLGYGSVLTGISTVSGGSGPRRPGRGGQGAIYGARGTAGSIRRSDIEKSDSGVPAESRLSGLQSLHQVKAPNHATNDDDEVPAKPDDLMEIGHKAQKGKDATKGEKPRKSELVVGGGQPKVGNVASVGEAEENMATCSFRRYPPDRLYGLGKAFSEQPDFLAKTSYIRGELPVIIGSDESAAIKSQSPVKKICIDSSSWDTPRDGQRPFSDGQNPSIVSLSSDPYTVGNSESTSGRRIRLDPTRVSALGDLYGPEKVHDMYLGVTLVGNAQCKWKMSPEITQEYGFSALNEAPDRKTLILVLDDQLNTKGQATLMIERDSVWGKGRRALKAQAAKGGGKGYERSAELFDDPRIFFHNGEPHVLYRQGPRFGYNDQIQNPLHFEVIMNTDGSQSFAAYVKASETFTVCCGRNIALISDDGMPLDKSIEGESVLRALTWVDPVTVVDIDTGKATKVDSAKAGRRRLTQSDDGEERRQLRSGGRQKERKSNIHGTNGYMVPLHSTSEVLGIAHFHRPEDRDTSDYALHGHHYTHALFTIARVDAADASNGAGEVQYRLKRLSNEFVFQSMSPEHATGEAPNGQAVVASSQQISDADIIQFASGLDLVGTDTDGRLLISYGINDCEGAAFFLEMKDVQKMLVDVPEGKQVVDLMAAPKP